AESGFGGDEPASARKPAGEGGLWGHGVLLSLSHYRSGLCCLDINHPPPEDPPYAFLFPAESSTPARFAPFAFASLASRGRGNWLRSGLSSPSLCPGPSAAAAGCDRAHFGKVRKIPGAPAQP